MKPLPPIRAMACERADASGSSGRGNGIRSMMTSWHDEPGTSTPCHSDSVPNRQVRGSRANCAHERADLVLALAEERDVALEVGEPLAHRLGGLLGRAHRREQPERATARGPHQRLDLVEGLGRRGRHDRAAAGAARRRRCPARGSRTGCRRRARATSGAPSPRRPIVPATASKLPPSSRVAEVSTTVRSSKTLSRTSIATLIGATRSTGPRRGSRFEPDDVELALLEDPRGVLEDLVDGRARHLPAAVAAPRPAAA